MIRTPLSAPTLLQSDFGAKALAKPSVMRVEANVVPLAIRLEKEMFSGRGDAICAQISWLNCAASSPGCGAPTMKLVAVNAATPPLALPSNERNALTNALGASIFWLALPRRLAMRKSAAPLGDSWKLSPSHATAFGANGFAGTLDG